MIWYDNMIMYALCFFTPPMRMYVDHATDAFSNCHSGKSEILRPLRGPSFTQNATNTICDMWNPLCTSWFLQYGNRCDHKSVIYMYIWWHMMTKIMIYDNSIWWCMMIHDGIWHYYIVSYLIRCNNIQNTDRITEDNILIFENNAWQCMIINNLWQYDRFCFI